jgi:DNA-binding transcriptional regulator/RsmH inhibitor MraZ
VAQSGVNLGLRGCKEAKIDDKGRLKLPTSFRADIESTWNTPSVYLTCDDAAGQYVRI